MSSLRVLYVGSEINPFLETTKVASFLKDLPVSMQEDGLEIRILVPRFGIINERKNRLHEVVRLSGINITLGDEEKPLVIKVASIPNAKLQVYFIDNEDYFHRKSTFYDKKGKWHADNDERIVFFCKGVMETVKKLGWAPDIIHCADWATGLIPMYAKTTYKKDPVFANSKVIYSVFNTPFKEKLGNEFVKLAMARDADEAVLDKLNNGGYHQLIQIGIDFADVATRSDEDFDPETLKLLDAAGDVKEFDAEISPETKESFLDLYKKLVADQQSEIE